MNWRKLPLIIAFVVGCGHKLKPNLPAAGPDAVLAMARARPVLNPTQARFHIKLRSKPLKLAGSTGGGLVVNRPGQGRLEIFGPLGGSLLKLISDGEAIAVGIPREKRHLLGVNAEEAIREATSGAAGVDDVLAILVGDLPFDNLEVVRMRKVVGGVLMVFEGPRGAHLDAVIEEIHGTLVQLELVDSEGSLLVSATYDDYQEVDDIWMPKHVELWMPATQLSVDLKFRQWKKLDEAPDVFSVAPPKGILAEPLEDLLGNLGIELGPPAPEEVPE